MKDEAKRLGTGHQWWAYRDSIYCNFCRCDTDSDRAFKTCKPEVAGKGFHTIVFDEVEVAERGEWGDSDIAQVLTDNAWQTAWELRALLDKLDKAEGR